MGQSDSQGRLMIVDLAPGQYTVLAWESVQRGAYQNAEFLMRYEGRGTPVNVSAGTRTTASVSLIPNVK
jgi:sarcosine oxidase gamma subunit